MAIFKGVPCPLTSRYLTENVFYRYPQVFPLETCPFYANPMQFFYMQHKCVIYAYSKNGVCEYFSILESLNSLGVAYIGYDWKAKTSCGFNSIDVASIFM